jgi:XTP/dITP diphosphohydrolase
MEFDRLVIATRNRDKFGEIAHILSDLSLELLPLSRFPDCPEVVEDRPDFLGNARKKALEVAGHTGLYAVADDSGLEVEALGGRPGVLSSRYSGEKANYRANNEKLLRELAGLPPERRKARFRCVAVLARPGEVITHVDGACEGVITDQPRGDGGFGYDPLFLVPELGKTFAELPAPLKNQISHRARAFRKFAEAVRVLLGDVTRC